MLLNYVMLIKIVERTGCLFIHAQACVYSIVNPMPIKCATWHSSTPGGGGGGGTRVQRGPHPRYVFRGRRGLL